MTLIWLCCALLLGIAAADTFGGPAMPFLIVAAVAGALAFVWRTSRLRLPFMLLSAFTLGVARDTAARPHTDMASVWTYANRSVVLMGTVERHPDWRDDVQIVVVASERLGIGTTSRAVYGLVRVQVSSIPELHYGQHVELRGQIELPREGKPFDFRAYLQRHDIYAVMQRPKVRVVGVVGGNGLVARLLALNDGLRVTVERLLPEPHAALIAGMLLGTQAAIPREVLADFRATGTSHLLVISGWNITVLVGGVAGFLVALGIPRRRAMALSLPVLVLYVLFVGASPSVLRAGIMGTLVIWAELADREPDAWTGLLLACAVLALLDPNVLWDTGFQLSALATAGIIAWQKPLYTALLRRLPANSQPLAGLIESLSVTLAALILTLPLLVYSFGTLALIAPVANLLLAPAVPPAMLFGALGAVAGLLFLPLGQLLALLAWPFTTWLLVGTHLLGGLPAAALSVAPFSGWWLAAWYGGLLVVVVWRLQPPKAAVEIAG